MIAYAAGAVIGSLILLGLNVPNQVAFLGLMFSVGVGLWVRVVIKWIDRQ